MTSHFPWTLKSTTYAQLPSLSCHELEGSDRNLTVEAAIKMIVVFVISRLDYCSSLLVETT